MPLPDPLYVLALVNVALVGSVAYLGFTLRRLRLYVMRLAQDRGKAVNEELIALWRRQLHRLPQESRRRRDYVRRLIEVGELDASGDEWQ